MSTFEPMSEVTLTDITNGSGLFSDERYTVKRAASTALHHLARARVAEEARDLAIVERDEAYRQRDEARDEGRAEPESVSHAANILTGAFLIDDFGYDIDDLAQKAADQVNAARTILGATDSEMLSDAARRVMESNRVQAETISEARAILGTIGWQALSVRASDVMAELRLLRDAAEAEPAQTFHPQISVTLVSGPGLDHTCAQVKVGLIGDPAFLALSGNDYARLALVVTRG